MTRHTLFACALALLLASPFAIAQDAPAPMPAPQARHDSAPMGHRMHRQRMQHGHGMGAFADLHALERLYREAGRENQLTAVYNDVLAKSQDPRLRTYVYHQLARLQARPANVDQAIATLRKSLAENLANEAKMRAGHDRMRAQWQQRMAAPEPAPR
jgi:predicted negative regulator of RcsB-dependent stress response